MTYFDKIAATKNNFPLLYVLSPSLQHAQINSMCRDITQHVVILRATLQQHAAVT